MIRTRFSLYCLISLAALGVLTGCSQTNRPATIPVMGTVTYRGKPVADASVVFLAPGAPRFAVGTTDASGNFRLTTFEQDDGAIPGTHVVAVRKRAAPAGPSYTAAPDGKIDPAAIERAMQDAARQIEKAETADSELPEKYADHLTSDLRFDVVDGENNFEIKLVD